jgi:5-formyltetrahydrofolate cyclo-ligase
VSDKREMRERAIARRDAMSAAARHDASRRIAEHALDLEAVRAARRVSGFHPFGSEVDCVPLLGELARRGATTALPVIVAKGVPLIFRAWAPGDRLAAGVWGILAPPESAEEVVPDLVLVPLVAFDGEGYRLGYGGGFYDRTLERLRRAGKVTAIGVAFACQEVGQQVGRVPREAHDARLDGVVTEDGARLFSKDAAAEGGPSEKGLS